MKTIQRDGWKLVRQMVTSSPRPNSEEWIAEVLVLPGAAQKRPVTDLTTAMALLRVALVGWGQSRHFRRQMIEEENLAHNDYLATVTVRREEMIPMLGVLRQIRAISRGELPAFGPATNDSALPLSRFRNALAQWPDSRAAIVVVPQHLRRTGDAGFVSVKYNSLPAQRSTAPRTFTEFCEYIEQALHHLEGHYLDLEKTRFMSPKEALDALAAPAKIQPKSVSSRHPFLTGCLKLVRAR